MFWKSVPSRGRGRSPILLVPTRKTKALIFGFNQFKHEIFWKAFMNLQPRVSDISPREVETETVII